MSFVSAVEIKGGAELRRALQRALRTGEPEEMRAALRPAAVIVRRAVMSEAPVGPTGKLRKSVVMRSSRTKPVMIVAIDRKKALRKSAGFPNGFPYVNSVMSEKRRGSKADKFVTRGYDKSVNEAADVAVANLAKTFERFMR